jgi:hypothetical protein
MKIEFTKDDKAIAVMLAKDDKANVLVTPKTTFSEALQLISTATLHILNSYLIAAAGQLPEEPTEEESAKFVAIKKQIYQAYNEAASSILELYAPEFELRPDLTTEAIQKAEEELINERFNKLTAKQKKAKDKIVKEAKKKLKEGE